MNIVDDATGISYVVLTLIAVASIFLWAHTYYLLSLPDLMPEEFVNEIRSLLINKKYEKALNLCKKENTLAALMLAKGIESRKQGIPLVVKAIHSEEKKQENLYWQTAESLDMLSKTAAAIAIATPILKLLFSHEFPLEYATLAQDFIGPLLFGIGVAGLARIFSRSLKSHLHDLLNTILTETITVVKSANLDH